MIRSRVALDEFIKVSESRSLEKCSINTGFFKDKAAVQVVCPDVQTYDLLFKERKYLRQAIYQLRLGHYLLMKVKKDQSWTAFSVIVPK